MKVSLSYAEQQEAQGVQADVEPLCRAFYKSTGLEGININVTSGLILLEGYDKKGVKANTALGFNLLRQNTAEILATHTVSRLRQKMYGESMPTRRRHLGQILLPDEWTGNN